MKNNELKFQAILDSARKELEEERDSKKNLESVYKLA